MIELYHFTASHLVQNIIEKGLVKGYLPDLDSSGKPVIYPGYIWLTKNPSFVQSWNTLTTLPYSRTAARFTVSIPKKFKKNILKWSVKGQALLAMFDVLNYGKDFENWYLFNRAIPPQWLSKPKFNN